jgi:hypothetical protein
MADDNGDGGGQQWRTMMACKIWWRTMMEKVESGRKQQRHYSLSAGRTSKSKKQTF